MNTIKVRNLEIGTGLPKICVPIVGRKKCSTGKSRGSGMESGLVRRCIFV